MRDPIPIQADQRTPSSPHLESKPIPRETSANLSEPETTDQEQKPNAPKKYAFYCIPIRFCPWVKREPKNKDIPLPEFTVLNFCGLPISHPFRRMLIRLSQAKWFDRFFLLAALGDILIVSLQKDYGWDIRTYTDFLFVGLYTSEVCNMHACIYGEVLCVYLYGNKKKQSSCMYRCIDI
jgi:hypothetical protein